MIAIFFENVTTGHDVSLFRKKMYGFLGFFEFLLFFLLDYLQK